jgi:hypothetical protein
MYRCKVVWGVESAGIGGYSVLDLEKSMIEDSDVAIFLLTQYAEGVLDELLLWKDHHNGLDNTLLVAGTDLEREKVQEYLGFPLPAATYVDEIKPWKHLHELMPKIHELITYPPRLIPPWRVQFNRFIQDNAISIKSKRVPIEKIGRLLDRLNTREAYKDWSFRINWPRADEPPRMDAYSREIHCLRLLEALANRESSAAGHEVEAVFDALERVFHSNERPPKKLSGNILFEDVSKNAQDYVQREIGTHPYERPHDARPGARHSPEQLGDPVSLLPPYDFLGTSDNYKLYQDAQRRIVKIANNVCKYVLCSSYQISISLSIHLGGKSSRLAHERVMMACTARNTNKEQLAAIADVPVLSSDAEGNLHWYGQPQRFPTSEYKYHWVYHNEAFERQCPKKLIVHFHPVDLLELYEQLKNNYGDNIPTELLEQGQKNSADAGFEFVLFREFLEYSARSAYFLS